MVLNICAFSIKQLDILLSGIRDSVLSFIPAMAEGWVVIMRGHNLNESLTQKRHELKNTVGRNRLMPLKILC
jgi:hypothetical protein